jgi:hypothetical protein
LAFAAVFTLFDLKLSIIIVVETSGRKTALASMTARPPT